MNVFDNLILNENALFFKKSKAIPKSKIEELLLRIAANRLERKYHFIKKKELIEVDGKSIHFSAVIFRIKKTPSFIREPRPDWIEVKFAYLMLIEYDNYCVVIKKNISNLAKFQNEFLTPIGYEVLVKMFLSERTEFKKMSIQNTDPSEHATRNSVFQSNDVKKSMPQFGLNRSIIGSLQILEKGETISLKMSTSRVNKLGSKTGLMSLFSNLISTTEKIKYFRNTGFSYIDNFATPLDFEANIGNKEPVGILFLWSELREKIERGSITHFTIKSKDDDDKEMEKDFSVDLFLWLLNRYDSLLEISPQPNNSKRWNIHHPFEENCCIWINKKSISLRSRLFQNITMYFEDGSYESLHNWITRKQQFLICFSEASYVYFSKNIFQDHKLLGSIESLRDVFLTEKELAMTTSEKGKPTDASTAFDDDCVFGVIENIIARENETAYLFCDDLGDEWADYIAVKENSICLYHAKAKKGCGLSASAFQDIIGQAQKNLGNILPNEERLKAKQRSWGNPYKLNNATTQIQKMRIGDTLKNGIETYWRKVNSYQTHFEIYLVVDFLSKKQLFDNLVALRDGTRVEQKAQVIQLLWFITSYVNSCKKIGFKPFIICRE